MPVYRLTPVEGTENSPQWYASSMRPYCLWVQASDEHEARDVVARATAVRGSPAARKLTLAPWKDSELVSCVYDNGMYVAPGIIRVRNTPFIVVPHAQEHRLSA